MANSAAFFNGDIRSITLPDGWTTCSEYAFGFTYNLEKVVFGKGLKQLDACVFSNCLSLQEVILPDGMEKIEDNAFEGCTSLAEITLPNTLTSLGSEVFCQCSNLQSVTLPASLTQIPAKTFNTCERLTEIFDFATTPQKVKEYSFKYELGKSVTVHVMPECVSAYQRANYWSRFTIVGDLDDYVTSIDNISDKVTDSKPVRYDLWGRRVGDNYRGLFIQR